jgi:hypothetical protein
LTPTLPDTLNAHGCDSIFFRVDAVNSASRVLIPCSDDLERPPQHPFRAKKTA